MLVDIIMKSFKYCIYFVMTLGVLSGFYKYKIAIFKVPHLKDDEMGKRNIPVVEFFPVY